MPAIQKLFKQEKAQAMVEFALVLPLLLLLLMGIVEFGRIINSHMIIANLAREGARFGAVGYTDTQISTMLIADRASLDASKIQININPGFSSRVKGEPLTVSVSYSVDLITPILSSILPNPVPINSQCTMRLE